MEPALRTILEGLSTGGPVALILGALCYFLWKQNRELMAKIDRQHDRMLKLAVRVQRAVEALAGLEAPEVEKDLNDKPGG